MKINLAKSAGFCLGVKRAIELALETAASRKKVYMLGDIVHNEVVAKQIRRAGVKKIGRLGPGRNKIFLVRAHGIPLDTLKKAAALGYQIVDATCPMVKQIHRIAQTMEQQGYKIIIIGDKKHEEVGGIAGHLKGRAIVIDRAKSIPLKIIKKIKKAAVVVQSTQNLDQALKIARTLKKHIRQLKFFNTVCKPTRIRQQEIKSMPLKNEVMIIIGSKNSANTKRLYQISKSLNPRSWRVGSKQELKKAWFKNTESVGVTAGASTPDATTREIICRIQRLNRLHG